MIHQASSAVRRWIEDRDGASFVEYVIVVGLVAIIAIVAFQNFGQAIVDKLTEETDAVKALQIQGGGGP